MFLKQGTFCPEARLYARKDKKEIIMKKSIVLLLVALICLVAFAGCGQKNKADFEFFYN